MPGFFVFVILGIRLSWREQDAEIDHEPRDDKPDIERYYIYGGEVESSKNSRGVTRKGRLKEFENTRSDASDIAAMSKASTEIHTSRGRRKSKDLPSRVLSNMPTVNNT